ncbi:MAG: pyridoxamine kinase [bacterium]|nr:pyridoxamine kinase [bacterium]
MTQIKGLAINDISCVGRCSLTVALPIISAMGIECSVLPTAVLSTHTGGFDGYTCLTLDNQFEPIRKHWEKLNREYDFIYSGFLCSSNQIELVSEYIKSFSTKDNIVLVDPAMADNGKLYSLFNMEYVEKMKELCCMADVIVPNITEACLLTEMEYIPGVQTKEYITELIYRLSKMGIKNIVLTGVSFKEGTVGVATYNVDRDEFRSYVREEIKGYYHGTGDIFASVLVGALAKGGDLLDSAKKAVDFTVDSILATKAKENYDSKYGVCFEEVLHELIEK